jgi:hypothetical protein
MRRPLPALLLVLAFFAVPAGATDSGSPSEMEKMMKAWEKYSTPGEGHRPLERMVGRWTTVTKMWMDPERPAMETRGTAEWSMTLGGRWLVTRYSGEFMGKPFEGVAMTGYDNFREVYISTWTDNVSTGLMSSTGSANGDRTVISLSGTMDEPLTGEKNKRFREVFRLTGPDTFTMEMYDTIEGKDVKVLEIGHTRTQ